MKQSLLIIFLSLISNNFIAQDSAESLESLQSELESLVENTASIKAKIKSKKWSLYKDQLKSYGLPSEKYLEHTAYFFEYSEQHEQAKWVAHMITPEVEQLGSSRTNDFRTDPLVSTQTANQDDYFNYYPEKSGDEQYETFGYDRGHLAPSADFRWYSKAVSESYFYSNMSPQYPDFNREKWSELESFLRAYVISNDVPLAVITAPLLTDELDKIPESPNGVSIPKSYIKIVYDPTNKRTIGFLMKNEKLSKPLDSYSVSVESIEKMTGLDFFSNIDDSLKSSYDITLWFSEYSSGNSLPIKQNTLPRGHYNTVSASSQINSYKKVSVCGKVVSSRYSRSGHAWINLDKKYPNDYFSLMIRKAQLTDFSYDPVTYLKNKNVCVQGTIGKFSNKPLMNLTIEEQIEIN